MLLRDLLDRYFHLIFVGLFFTMSCCLLFARKIWDEAVYLQLAADTLSNPLKPFHPMLSWVPHPPLLWYLLAFFYPIPRMATLLTSAICILFLFHVCRTLYGHEVAKLSVAVLVSTPSYLLFSLVVFPDGPLTTFMTISVFSFLCWTKLEEHRYFLFTGLGFALASLTKYTPVPILLGTYVAWSVILRSNLSLSRALKLFGVIGVSSLPLAFWTYDLSKLYGNIVYHYSSIYHLFPNNVIATFTSNIIYYTPYFFLLAGLPFVSWIRKRSSFDLDSKLLLIYLTNTFLPFASITIHWYRYLLPMAPVMAVISARSLVREKVSVRFLILCSQILIALFIPLALLVWI